MKNSAFFYCLKAGFACNYNVITLGKGLKQATPTGLVFKFINIPTNRIPLRGIKSRRDDLFVEKDKNNIMSPVRATCF